MSGIRHDVIFPEDILRPIFELVYQNQPMAWNTQPHCVSVILSHVCRDWRNAAIDFNLLWSTIHWDDRDLPKTGFGTVDALLRRSKDASINIKINLFGQFGAFDRFVDAILPHIWRCRELRLVGRPHHIVLFLRSIATLVDSSAAYVGASRLEYLTIRPTGRRPPLVETDLRGRLFGGVTPNLRIVHLDSIGAWNTLESSLPNIKVLQTNHITHELHLCSSLEKLDFRGGAYEGGPFDLPAIRNLTWSFRGWSFSALGLLSIKSWAALTVIDLNLTNLDVIFDIIAQTPNVRCASLRARQMMVYIIRPAAYLPLLERLHVHLDIGDRHLDGSLFSYIHTPRLQELAVRCQASSKFKDWVALSRLIQRCHPPLIKLSLMNHTTDDKYALYKTIRSLPDLRRLELTPRPPGPVKNYLERMLKINGGLFTSKLSADGFAGEWKEGSTMIDTDEEEDGDKTGATVSEGF